jgi:hypothetical protein
VGVVLPGTEYGVVAAAALAEAWGLPRAGLVAARAFRDKARLRTVAGQTALRQPQRQLVTTATQVAHWWSAWGGHCVLKPANRQASQPTSQPRPPTTTDLPARSFSGLLDHLATLTRNTLRVGTDTAGEFDLVASPPRPSDRPSICSAQPSRCGSSSQQATPDRNENAWSAMVNPIHDHVTSG